MFANLNPPYGVILADPPWRFVAWSDNGNRAPDNHYKTMTMEEIAALPVGDIAADDCTLFLWGCWPTMPEALRVMSSWGFQYKTCAFSWMKANGRQIDLFQEEIKADMLLGYWTRSNSEFCLLGTRGKPKRQNADVRQGIIEPRREHSRKPDCQYERIERLMAGPYVELFARNTRPGWDSWGAEVGKFESVA